MRVFTRFYVLYCVVGLAWINKNLVESWRKTPAAVSQYRKSSYFNSLQLRHHKDNQQLDQVDNTYFTQIRRDLSRFVQYGSGALLFAQSVVAAGTPVSPRITQKAYIDIKIANYTEESTGTNRGAKGSGRIVFGLYGDIAPRSVQSFLDTVRSDGEEDPSYYNSIFSRISPDGVLEIEKVRGVNTVTIAGSEQLEYNGKLLSPAPPLETSTIKHFK